MSVEGRRLQELLNISETLQHLGIDTDKTSLINYLIKIIMASKHAQARSSYTEPSEGRTYQLVLVGQEKVGKSSSGNTIMGRKVFDCSLGFAPVTLKSEKAEGDVFNKRVTVVDTPGLCNSKLSEEQQKTEMEEALLLSAPGPHAFLYVVQLGRFTEQEHKAMETMERILSPDISAYIIVLFTYGDRLEDTNIEQFIREDENLKKLVDKCGGKYHVFYNKDTGNRDQVRELLETVDTVSESGYRCYVRPASGMVYWVKGLFNSMWASLNSLKQLLWGNEDSGALGAQGPQDVRISE